MITVVLFGWAVLLVAGSSLLVHAGWPLRAPRLAVATWQSLSGSLLTTVALGGLTLALPTWPWPSLDGAFALMRACLTTLRGISQAPAIVLCLAGAGVAGALVARVGWLAQDRLRKTACRNREHAEGLVLLGRDDSRPGVVVVDSPTLAAYALPGRRQRIVLSSSAMAALSPAGVNAVVDHERAHLRGRHHLPLTTAVVLSRALPGCRVLREARRQIAALLEMLADDHARRRQNGQAVAEALRALGAPSQPGPTATIDHPFGAHGVRARVQRLLAPLPRLASRWTALIVLTTSALAVAPPLLVAGFALLGISDPLCPWSSC